MEASMRLIEKSQQPIEQAPHGSRRDAADKG
jgi:hypothetical protein